MPVFSTGGGGSSGPTTQVVQTFACPGAVAVGDAVYQTAVADTVDKALMAAGVTQTPEAIGIVIVKPTATTCTVVLFGLAAVPGALVAGSIYYVSNAVAGGITATPPSSKGEKIQRIGVAVNATLIDVDPDLTSVVV